MNDFFGPLFGDRVDPAARTHLVSLNGRGVETVLHRVEVDLLVEEPSHDVAMAAGPSVSSSAN
jgi:hypothetical protein